MKFLRAKHRRYLDLWDVFHYPGCPICNLIERHHDQIAKMIYDELVGVDKTKIKPGRMTNFCNVHIWEMRNICSLAAKTFFTKKLQRIEENLHKLLLGHKRHSKFIKVFDFIKTRQRPATATYSSSDETTNCLICDAVMREEELYLKALMNSMDDFDFAQSYRRSDGICSLHFKKTLSRFLNHRNIPLLMDEQLKKVGMIIQKIRDDTKRAGMNMTLDKDDEEWWNSASEFLMGKNEVAFLAGIRRMGEDRKCIQVKTIFQDFSEEDKEEKQNQEDVLEDISFNHEKLRRQYEELQKNYLKESSRAAALHYKCWKISEDNKTLEMNYVGAKARARGYKEELDYSNRKIERLEEDLKRKKHLDKSEDVGSEDL